MSRQKNTRLRNILHTFSSGDYDQIDSLIQKIISSDDREIWSALLEGTVISSDGYFYAGEKMTVSGNRQPSVDYALLELIGYAPDDLPVNDSIRKTSVKKLRIPYHETQHTVYWCMKKFPIGIYRLQHLKYLELTQGAFPSIPSGISALRELEYFEVITNSLTCLPEDLAGCSMLTDILVSKNRLKQLPPGMDQLTELKRLDLHYNQIAEWPSALNNLAKLEWLNLADNHLRSKLPEEIIGMRSLKKLILNGNVQMPGIPAAITELPALEELNLERCKSMQPKLEVKNLKGDRLHAWFRKVRKSYGLPPLENLEKMVAPILTTTQTETFDEEVDIEPTDSSEKRSLSWDDEDDALMEAHPLLENLSHYFTSRDPDTMAAGMQLLLTLDDPEIFRLIFRKWTPDLLFESEKYGWQRVFPPALKLSKRQVLSLMVAPDIQGIKSLFDCSSIDRLSLGPAEVTIPGILEAFPKLKVLHLDLPNRKIPSSLRKCNTLKRLEIRNLTTTKPLKWTGMPHLEELAFSTSGMPSLTVHDCPSLRLFSYCFGKSEQLEIHDCPALEDLQIMLPSLKSIRVNSAKALKSLDLGYRDITDVLELPSLDHLQSFVIRDPKDIQLLNSLDNARSLQILAVDCHNRLSRREFKGLLDTPIPAPASRKLKEVTFNHLGISKFPDWLLDQPALEILDMSYNLLEEIPADWSGLRSMELMNLAHNRLKNIPKDIRLPESLEEIDFSGNMLSDIPVVVANLPKLNTLRLNMQSHDWLLKNTKLSKIHPSIATKPGLNLIVTLRLLDKRKMKARNILHLINSGEPWEQELSREFDRHRDQKIRGSKLDIRGWIKQQEENYDQHLSINF